MENKVPELEKKVAALVISNQMSARIDSTNATLHAKHTEQRGISFRKVPAARGRVPRFVLVEAGAWHSLRVCCVGPRGALSKGCFSCMAGRGARGGALEYDNSWAYMNVFRRRFCSCIYTV